jgi:hypothetical protein
LGRVRYLSGTTVDTVPSILLLALRGTLSWRDVGAALELLRKAAAIDHPGAGAGRVLPEDFAGILELQGIPRYMKRR